MARARGKLQRFNFSKGWNTEANPMTFPENTAQDLENVVLDIDGSIRRRLGVSVRDSSIEPVLQGTYEEYESAAIGFGKWLNVAGSGDLNFIVTQESYYLHFSTEDGTEIGIINFSSEILPGRVNDAAKEVLEFSSGLGYLFCTGPYTEPFYVEYDVDTEALSIHRIEIKIRDFEGVDDGYDVDYRAVTIDNLHEYNLRNQGWVDSFDCAVNGGSEATTDPVEYTKTHLGVYPSNADILYLGKAGSGTDEDDIGRYDPKTMAKNVFGTTRAPRGHFIMDAFNQDRAAISGIANVTSLTINTRPRAVAFHNGRVFYAGINAVGQSGNVYYSQQLTDITKIGNCYQDNDPTAEEFNELLATDGGLIKIPDCGNILRLQEGPQGIVVFASNGVWEISGENGRFAADNLFVRKVTELGCVSRESVLDADTGFFYFSEAGIVGSKSDQVTGNLNMEVITNGNIQKGYLNIGGPQRADARGAYMRADKKLVWLYSTNSGYNRVNNRFKYNGVLILDLNLGAFYKYRIADPSGTQAPPYVSGIVESDSVVLSTADENVTASGNAVTASGEEVTVTVESTSTDSLTSTMLLQAVYPVNGSDCGITTALFSSKLFTDWYLLDNVGGVYQSFIETGYELGGEAMLDKQPKYVHTYMSKTPKHSQTGSFYNIADNTSEFGFSEGNDLGSYVALPYRKTGLADSDSCDCCWGDNGYTFWHYNTGNPDTLYSYPVTVPYNVTTIQTGSVTNHSYATFQNEGFKWSKDGHYALVCTFAHGVSLFYCETPWDWGGRVGAGSFNINSLPKLVNTQLGDPDCSDCSDAMWAQHGDLNPEATHICVLTPGLTTGTTPPTYGGYGVQEYALTVPGDASTAYATGNWVSFRGLITPEDYKTYQCVGFSWNHDGSAFYFRIRGGGNERVYRGTVNVNYRLVGVAISPVNYLDVSYSDATSYYHVLSSCVSLDGKEDIYCIQSHHVDQYYKNE